MGRTVDVDRRIAYRVVEQIDVLVGSRRSSRRAVDRRIARRIVEQVDVLVGGRACGHVAAQTGRAAFGRAHEVIDDRAGCSGSFPAGRRVRDGLGAHAQLIDLYRVVYGDVVVERPRAVAKAIEVLGERLPNAGQDLHLVLDQWRAARLPKPGRTHAIVDQRQRIVAVLQGFERQIIGLALGADAGVGRCAASERVR